MKHRLRALAAVAALTTLTGCIELETVVRVSPDGSGTVSERMILSSAVVEQMKAMSAELAAMQGISTDKALEGFDVVDRGRLEKRAAAMGDGVTLEKIEPLAADWGKGYAARYRFTDINGLRIDQNPSSAVPTGPALEPVSHEVLAFRFVPGSKAALTVTMPDPEPPGSALGIEDDTEGEGFPPGEAAEEAEEQMREMFRDLHVAVVLEVDGEIVATNATHREGSRITLMELDFSKILEDPEKFEAMQNSQPQTLEEAKEIMADLPGVKVEMEREITVTFR